LQSVFLLPLAALDFAKHRAHIVDEVLLWLPEIEWVRSEVAGRHGRTKEQRTACDQHCLPHAWKIDNSISISVHLGSRCLARLPLQSTAVHSVDAYEVRPRKDKRGVDLISNALPFGGLWYAGPNAISNAIGYAMHRSRSHHAVIRVYSDAGNAVETHEHAGRQ
jgi:hypothetical protein